MTARILPDCRVSHRLDGRCGVVKSVERLHRDTFARVDWGTGEPTRHEVDLLTVVAPPPAIPKHHLRGLA